MSVWAIRACILYLLPVSLAQANVIQFLDKSGSPVSDVVVTYEGERSTSDSAVEVMDQKDKQFVPHVLVINKGQQVSFPNSDNIRHHVYSFSDTRPFELKLYHGEDTAPVLFDQAGVVALGCNIHDRMVGYIYVSNNLPASKSGAEGKVTVPDNISTITVWHPQLDVYHSKQLTYELSGQRSDVITLSLVAIPSQQTGEGTFGNRKFGNSGS